MISTTNNPTKQSFNGGAHHTPSERLTPFKANHIVKCEKVGSVHFLILFLLLLLSSCAPPANTIPATCGLTNHDLSLSCTIVYEGKEYRNVWEVKR